MNNNISDIVESVVKKIAESNADLSLFVAKKVASEVESEAERIKVNAVVAIFNKAARPVLVECMEESFVASYDIAVNKAYTSAALKMSTAELKKLANPGGPLYGVQNTNRGKIVIFGGGDPLKIGGKTVGAIGVSGGTEDEDTYLSDFGRKAFDRIIAEKGMA